MYVNILPKNFSGVQIPGQPGTSVSNATSTSTSGENQPSTTESSTAGTNQGNTTGNDGNYVIGIPGLFNLSIGSG